MYCPVKVCHLKIVASLSAHTSTLSGSFCQDLQWRAINNILSCPAQFFDGSLIANCEKIVLKKPKFFDFTPFRSHRHRAAGQDQKRTLAVTVEPFKFSPAEPVASERSEAIWKCQTSFPESKALLVAETHSPWLQRASHSPNPPPEKWRLNTFILVTSC